MLALLNKFLFLPVHITYLLEIDYALPHQKTELKVYENSTNLV